VKTKELSKTEKYRIERLNKAVSKIFGSEEGRFFLGWLLDKSGLYLNPVEGQHLERFIGRREMGILVLGLCNTVDPSIYLKTLEENTNGI
jgi:hypothetical protein